MFYLFVSNLKIFYRSYNNNKMIRLYLQEFKLINSTENDKHEK